MIFCPDAPVHGLAQEVTAASRAEGARLREELEVEGRFRSQQNRFQLAVLRSASAILNPPALYQVQSSFLPQTRGRHASPRFQKTYHRDRVE